MDTTELTTTQLDELRERLQKLRDELQAQLPPGDDGTHTTGVRLKKVLAALHKFPGGDYGMCEECEEPIGYQRLKAHPETPVCAECQAARTADR